MRGDGRKAMGARPYVLSRYALSPCALSRPLAREMGALTSID